MAVKLNNISSWNNLITFSDVPTIVSIEQSSYEGVRAKMNLTFNTVSHATETGQTISILDETITSVDDMSAATGRNFYISPSNTSTAYGALRALRNCPWLSANYDIFINDYNQPIVTILAKEPGEASNLSLSTTFTSSELVSSTTGGTLASDDGASVYGVDIFSGSEFITTLTKSAINDVQHFDVAPVLSTIAEYGKLVPYTLRVFGADDSDGVTRLSTMGGYVTPGYYCHGHSPFISTSSMYTIASDGGSVYTPSITFSYLNLGTRINSVKVTYKDSANMTVTAETVSVSGQAQGYKHVEDITVPLTESAMTYSTSVQISGSMGTAEYAIEKPLDATEGATRIYWRNPYGGLDFLDFTGAESIKVTNSETTYRPSYYDFYESDTVQKDRTYKKDITHTHSLSSKFTGEGILPLYASLNASPYVYIEEDGKKVMILIDSLTINEDNDVNGVYTVSIDYKRSREDYAI